MEDSEAISHAKEDVAAHAEMYRERHLTTELSLWNTLAALDGLLISAASVLAAFGRDIPVWCPLGVVGASVISLILLCLNFYGRRNLYRTLGREPPESVWLPGPAFTEHIAYLTKRKQDHQAEQHRAEWRENVCAFLAGSALVLIIIGIYFASRHVESTL